MWHEMNDDEKKAAIAKEEAFQTEQAERKAKARADAAASAPNSTSKKWDAMNDAEKAAAFEEQKKLSYEEKMKTLYVSHKQPGDKEWDAMSDAEKEAAMAKERRTWYEEKAKNQYEAQRKPGERKWEDLTPDEKNELLNEKKTEMTEERYKEIIRKKGEAKARENAIAANGQAIAGSMTYAEATANSDAKDLIEAKAKQRFLDEDCDPKHTAADWAALDDADKTTKMKEAFDDPSVKEEAYGKLTDDEKADVYDTHKTADMEAEEKKDADAQTEAIDKEYTDKVSDQAGTFKGGV
jgi:hypothetical protein